MNNHIRINNNRTNLLQGRERQRGLAMVLFTIGMLVVVVIAGLALDVSHAMLNKTRLQNMMDVAALAAAQTLDDTGDVTLATATARDIYDANKGLPGYAEIAAEIARTDVTVEFSATLEPFNTGATTTAEYVRVKVNAFSMTPWLVQIIGIEEKVVRASAVSGPSPPLGSVCGLVPLIVCGDPANPSGTTYGYEKDEISILKSGSQTDYDSGLIGPGNFQLARVNGNGANVLEENLAQGIPDCEGIGDTIDTEPGNKVGPVADGLNNRFANYGPGNADKNKYDKNGDPIASDTVITEPTDKLEYNVDNDTIEINGQPLSDTNQPDFVYADYKDVTPANYDFPPGQFASPGRRILPVVISDCSGSNTGQSTLPVLTIGCFFMLQQINDGDPGGGNEAEVYGQFIENCKARGGLSDTNPTDGPYKIVLYNDYNSKDS